MADPRFFRNFGPLRLGDLAELSGSTMHRGADPDALFEDVAPLEQASAGQISFLDNRKYLDQFARSSAGACVVEPGLADQAPAQMMLLLTDKPYRAYAKIARAFYPVPESTGRTSAAAHVDPTAICGSGCEIGPGAVVGPAAELGDKVRLEPGVVIGTGVVIGDGSQVGANAALSHCIIGRRANIHPGVRIGQRGFGFDMDPAGHLDVPQLGRVIIGDDVEVGANSTIDRGAGPDTRIGDCCKIDNLVQIGHNAVLGQGCVVVAQAGVSGSTRFGDYAVLAAQGGVAGHLKIGAGAQIGAQAGVMRDVPPGAKVVGTPAMPAREFFRSVAALAKLTRTKG